MKYIGHHVGSVDFTVNDDASKLLSVTGNVYVQQGATFTAPVLASAGTVYVWQGATFTAGLKFVGEIYREIANSGYALFASPQKYEAGCRGPWSAKKALAHWNRTDARAVDFTAAIKSHEASKGEQ